MENKYHKQIPQINREQDGDIGIAI